MNSFEQRLLHASPAKLGEYRGIEVRFMDRVSMSDFFGYALGGKIFIRQDLSDRVQKFVIGHEYYHLNDKAKWLGWIGSEIRANLYSGLKEPRGLVATIAKSLNSARFKLYVNLLANRSNEA